MCVCICVYVYMYVYIYRQECLTSLDIREIEVKTIMKCHLTPVRMAIINRIGNNKCWRGCGLKKQLSFTAGGNIKWNVI